MRGIRRVPLPFVGLPAVAFLAFGACAEPKPGPVTEEGPGAFHVFLFIGDGMGRSSEIIASRSLYGSDEGLAWSAFPVQAWATTWDVDTYEVHAGKGTWNPADFDPAQGYDPAQGGAEPWAPGAAADPLAYLTAAATDSAAAATALSTGLKTDAGNIAWEAGDPADSPLVTIAERLRSRRGAAIGVVSTVPFNHATPASFAAHSTGRGSYAPIAEEIITMTKPEVVIGGGHPDRTTAYFSLAALAALRASPFYDLAELVAGGDGASALDAAAAALPEGRGLFGLFGSRSDGAFEAPVVSGDAGSFVLGRGGEDPSLAEVVLAATRVLARDPDGFFLMAEQGDIDWANHGHDAARMVGAVASLDEAVRATIDYIGEPGDAIDWSNSLLIVTADHATGLPRPGADGSISWPTGGHGNELVRVAAMGERALAVFGPLIGADFPGTSIMDNTGIYEAMVAFTLGADLPVRRDESAR